MEDAMADVREVHEVPVSVPVRRRRTGLAALLMFLFGAVLILVVGLVVLRPTWTISWPAGRLDIGIGYKPATPPAALTNNTGTQSAQAQ